MRIITFEVDLLVELFRAVQFSACFLQVRGSRFMRLECWIELLCVKMSLSRS